MSNRIVVLGSGLAGLNFALKVAQRGYRVLILTKSEISESATRYAQGGIAAVLSQHDSFEAHIEDTLKAGAYHNDKQVVETIVKSGPSAISDLVGYGVDFKMDKGDELALTREGGHSARRIAYVGDHTGQNIEQSLIEKVKSNPKIEVIEGAFGLDVHTKDGAVAGIFYVQESENSVKFEATDSVVLATGGIGQVYKFTTNPKVLTGDGIAMALRAGATVRDMEFVQFHPTVFFGNNEPFLISEAVRGEGGLLVDQDFNRFVDELAPRDVVARAIFEKLQTGSVFLDCRQISEANLAERFPTIYAKLASCGLAMEQDLIPVAPAAHYLCGGIQTDLNGFTTVYGLYALGECASTGLHGANRLASNSLLEASVMSGRLAEKIEPGAKLGVEVGLPKFFTKLNLELDYDSKIRDFKQMMWENLGIYRTNDGVTQALDYIDKELKEITGEAVILETIPLNYLVAQTYLNMLQTGLEIANGSLARKESLGCHLMVN